MEDGEGYTLNQTVTDDPDNHRAGTPENRRHQMGGHSAGRHAVSTPNATSNPRSFNRAEGIQIPGSASPSNSIPEIKEENDRECAETTTSEQTYVGNSHAGPSAGKDALRSCNTGDATEKHSIKKLFSKSFSRDTSRDDDNNGKEKKKFTARGQIRATLFNSWINVLLIASPVGIAVHYAGVNDVAVFVINFIAIIPLAAMLSYATEEIALRTGEVIGGLLNASFGNAVELIVSIIALAKDQVLIVQTSLIGSMLSNLLLVLGMCFFFGGVNRMEQAFNMTVAQTASSLLFVAVGSLLIPTVFEEWARTQDQVNGEDPTPDNPGAKVTAISRGTAILLLVVYGCYLFFQLKSHTAMYNAPSEKNKKRAVGSKFKSAVIPEKFRNQSVVERNAAAAAEAEADDAEDEPEEPQLSIWVAVLTLALSTVLVALNAEYLVDSINAITCGGGISKSFVGLILLPIVGNAAEHATAVTVAIKDKMDLAIGVAVGSSMQIALLVLPFIVVLGWIMGKDDMTLFFDGFQIAVLFVAVLLVNYLIQDGKSHWLEGVLLMILYIIIAVAAWFYPTAPGASDCPAE
ncbi:Ca2+:H+ antiporter [Exophiala aquamarina CBS 119918]|uniref:Ca2+:H+ antiporter n=1 Tax=Exophiala aquamarina CBS 119918 TaxID=1182545 RepID=A0A072P2U0_9EURO|nr:Ca2+:H+ antiporter [Exophiala aquamarina CBS 119918]KEF54017.1 Ca2+:H+ antiporter [Exophiala aquamarina CBS 119918]